MELVPATQELWDYSDAVWTISDGRENPAPAISFLVAGAREVDASDEQFMQCHRVAVSPYCSV